MWNENGYLNIFRVNSKSKFLHNPLHGLLEPLTNKYKSIFTWLQKFQKSITNSIFVEF